MNTTVLVPRPATLDGFTDDVSRREGINLRDLTPFSTVHVRTRNSLYRIVVLDGTRILVQGGQFFPESTDTHLSGSGLGGSLLKIGCIAVGLRMEFLLDHRRIVTSRVSEVSVDPPAPGDRPH
jgi:hypothetical protein